MDCLTLSWSAARTQRVSHNCDTMANTPIRLTKGIRELQPSGGRTITSLSIPLWGTPMPGFMQGLYLEVRNQCKGGGVIPYRAPCTLPRDPSHSART